MTRRMLPLLVALAACSRPASSPAVARLEADWTGSDTGRMAGAARAEWCDTLGVLEIRAAKGDSGIAVAIFPADSVRPDSYPVVMPARADSARPAAGVALRLFAETAIKGFRGDSGSVIIETMGPGGVSGRFAAGVRSVTTPERLTLRGTFHGVRPVRAGNGCRAAPVPGPAEPGVD